MSGFGEPPDLYYAAALTADSKMLDPQIGHLFWPKDTFQAPIVALCGETFVVVMPIMGRQAKSPANPHQTDILNELTHGAVRSICAKCEDLASR